MADTLSNPDGGGMTSGGTTAADNLTGTHTQGAVSLDGAPVNNDTAPADPTQSPFTVPTGGQKAVPDDQTLMGNMDNDAGGFGSGDGGTGVDDGDTLPGDDIHPAISASDTPTDSGGLAPTGGLSG